MHKWHIMGIKLAELRFKMLPICLILLASCALLCRIFYLILHSSCINRGALKQLSVGHIFADLELSNPRNLEIKPVKVKALADTGALMLCIPEHISLQLDLEIESMREVSVADGRYFRKPLSIHEWRTCGRKSRMAAL